ncbi:MAG: aminopeptidase P family N-terminal domain-containing protein [Acidimicrobiia bacterium]
MSIARLKTVDLPEFGRSPESPRLPDELYRSRLEELRRRMTASGHSNLVVYADREHSANLAYLTGFDPRFEEALLILGANGAPVLATGNECVGMALAAPVPLDVVLFQGFSLPGQPRDSSPALSRLLQDAGVQRGDSIGVVGWKTLPDQHSLDVPSYLADELRSIAGDPSLVVNATGLLIDAADGLRVINEVEQLAVFEHAATHTSNGVRSLLFGLRPGMTEEEAVSLLGWNGSPLSCHLMLTAGERAALGLLSPGERPIERGDPLTVAYGIWGALNCRAGFVVSQASELPPAIPDYVEKLVRPYFETVAEWYQALHVGQTGGTLQEIVNRGLGDPFFGIFLNPGHQIHLDEWVNSPVAPGSTIELRSGMALQVDIIPATGTAYFTTNIEDGIALADEALRSQFAARYPDGWERIERRRRFMRDELGIDLHEDVLPFSNIPAHLPPFLLSPDRAMSLT